VSHFLGDAAYAFGFDDSNGKTSESGDVFWTMAGAYPTAVFVIVPVDDVVAAVFDAPMAAVGGKNPLGVGLFGLSAGQAIGDFMGVLTAFFVCGLPFDDKSLSNVRKVEVVVEFGCSPDFADFDSSVVRGCTINKIWLSPVFKVQLDVLKKTWLVCFDGEVIMRLAFADQVVGNLALGQQGIAGNFFAFDIDGIQQRDGRLDLVGTLELFTAFYGQGTDFFWV
jgi:hypothetical protein